MFNRKLILTATTCRILEGIRLAIEVWNGAPIRFEQVELEKGLRSGRGLVFLGSGDLTFTFTTELRAYEQVIQFDIAGKWWVARINSMHEVCVIESHYIGKPGMWWVGTSFADRHKEPLFPEHQIQA